jgi:PIN domain nuclease of toxin-antitoxin system
MIAGVADTHTALWHLFDDKRLSSAAEASINEAATTRRKIAISTISLAEVVYLIEKNRLPQSAYDELTQALADPEHVFTEQFRESCKRSFSQIVVFPIRIPSAVHPAMAAAVSPQTAS